MSESPFSVQWPSKPHRDTICQWLLYSLVGGLLPIWGSLLYLLVTKWQFQLDQYIVRGDFALYAAAMASAALFTATREFRKAKIPARGWLVILLVLILLVAAIVYCGVLSSPGPLPLTRMVWFTCPLYLTAVTVSVVVYATELQINEFNPHDMSEAQIGALATKVTRRRSKKSAAAISRASSTNDSNEGSSPQ